MCKSIQQYLHQLEEDMWSDIVNTYFQNKASTDNQTTYFLMSDQELSSGHVQAGSFKAHRKLLGRCLWSGWWMEPAARTARVFRIVPNSRYRITMDHTAHTSRSRHLWRMAVNELKQHIGIQKETRGLNTPQPNKVGSPALSPSQPIFAQNSKHIMQLRFKQVSAWLFLELTHT